MAEIERMLKTLIKSLENKSLNSWTLFSNQIGEKPHKKPRFYPKREAGFWFEVYPVRGVENLSSNGVILYFQPSALLAPLNVFFPLFNRGAFSLPNY
jgi:hypothetical protein